MRFFEAVDSSTQGAGRYHLTDDELALSFSIHFNWGYPDYVREAFQWMMQPGARHEGLDPHRNLTWKQLRALLEEADSPEMRMFIAGHEKTSQSVLNFLANSTDSRLVQRVAENPNTHVATLTRLIRHEARAVRIAVADHASTPDQLLHILAYDHDCDVRFALAENPKMPQIVLEKLANDENPYVAARAQRNLARLTAPPAQVVVANFRNTLWRIQARKLR